MHTPEHALQVQIEIEPLVALCASEALVQSRVSRGLSALLINTPTVTRLFAAHPEHFETLEKLVDPSSSVIHI